MANEINPLEQKTPIVDTGGRPTPRFIKQWMQQLRKNTSLSALIATLQAQVAALITRNINTTGGLQGGGNLSADRTLSLTDTGVSAGSYSSADITVDSKGRITAAANGAGGGGATAFLVTGDTPGPVFITNDVGEPISIS